MLAFLTFATATAIAQPLGLAPSGAVAALRDSVAKARPDGADIGRCKGLAGTEYLGRMQGRAGFSKPEYLAALGANNAEARKRCFAFAVGREDDVADCLLDAAIDGFRWHHGLLAGAE